MCVRSASTGLCGGCRVTGIPTATQPAERPAAWLAFRPGLGGDGFGSQHQFGPQIGLAEIIHDIHGVRQGLQHLLVLLDGGAQGIDDLGLAAEFLFQFGWTPLSRRASSSPLMMSFRCQAAQVRSLKVLLQRCFSPEPSQVPLGLL